MGTMEKEKLREYAIGTRNALPKTWRREADEKIAKLLFKSSLFQSCPTIFCYVSRSDEIDTRKIIEYSLAADKKIAVPRTYREERKMEFVKIESLQELKLGKFGILEPSETCRVQTATETTLCLIPALCVDNNGHRLGFGGGYYDRFLKNFPGKTVVLVYEFLSKSRFPIEAHDVAAGNILTEKGFRFSEERYQAVPNRD